MEPRLSRKKKSHMNEKWTRRQYLAGSAVVVAGLAGCAEDNTGSNEDGKIFDGGETHQFESSGMEETDRFDLNEGIVEIDYEIPEEDITTAHLVSMDDGTETLLLNWSGPLEAELARVVTGGEYLLSVEAEGDWSFEINQPEVEENEVEGLPYEAEGSEPTYVGPVDVPEEAEIHAQHDGKSEHESDPFSVDTLTADGLWSGFNESGNVDMTRPLRDDGVMWFSIHAYHDWSFEVSE
ncbi:hypothetical protein [Natronosalvus amylolyticus]|uniref:hypothetical protein n=1 Tax=Natronosalvus amylolyticus TaxID=2961994 RepID=UPI0020C947AF|nr:hypothetical protein [Natronosalvus amylolyticus]